MADFSILRRCTKVESTNEKESPSCVTMLDIKNEDSCVYVDIVIEKEKEQININTEITSEGGKKLAEV